MNAKVTMPIVGVILILFLTGFFILPISPASKTYDLAIIKIGDNWKVVDANDHAKTKVKVKKEDTIVWSVSGTDAYFQFPLELFDAVSSADSLKNGYTKFVKDGKKLKLKVKDDAPAGTYEYAVFCTADGVFAEGDSPPKIIIE